MIVRLWHGRVPAEKAARYRAFLNQTAIPDYRSVPGNISVHVLERAEGAVTHFVTLTFWQSMDAVRSFAGPDVEAAKYYPEDRDFLLELEPAVVHYQVAGTSLKEEGVQGHATSAQHHEEGRVHQPETIVGVHGVRYQVKDVARAVSFYTEHLGFKLEHQQLPAFASISFQPFTLLLSGPGASGSRPMPGGEAQEPGGWNRVVLRVKDLPARMGALKDAGVTFRNAMEVGPGGRQVQIEDPDGNPIELFEPASR